MKKLEQLFKKELLKTSFDFVDDSTQSEGDILVDYKNENYTLNFTFEDNILELEIVDIYNEIKVEVSDEFNDWFLNHLHYCLQQHYEQYRLHKMNLRYDYELNTWE